MTVQGLIKAYKKHNPNGHYFDDANLKFFGDDLENATVKFCRIPIANGTVAVWRYRAVHLNAPIQPYVSVRYFHAQTFEEVDPYLDTYIAYK